jgi:hypothetical protein
LPGRLRGSNCVWVRVPSPGGCFWLMPAALAVGWPWGVGRAAGVVAAARRCAGRAGRPRAAAATGRAAQHRAQPLSLVVLSAGGFWQEGRASSRR